MTGQEFDEGGHATQESLDARLAGYLAAAGIAATALACEADAAIVANTATQTFGVNGVVSIDFNVDGQTDFQVDHDRVNVPGVGDLDYLQIDKNDVNGEGNPLAFDPGPNMTLQATPFMNGATPRNDANEAAHVIAGPQGSYPAALSLGTPIGSGSTFDFQEGDNFLGSGDWIRANRLIDEDATQIDQVLGGRPADSVFVPTNGPNWLGLGGEVRYLGVKMDLNNAASAPGDPFTYGWIGVRIDNEGEATGAVVGYAYESTPGAGILAGDTGAVVGNGDYDDDGDTDGNDFLVWQRQVGTSPGAGMGADGNGDNLVNGLDLDIWRSDFGSATVAGESAAATVPEPGSLLMAGLGAALLACWLVIKREDANGLLRFSFAVKVASVRNVPNEPTDASSSAGSSASVQHLVELGYEDPLAAALKKRREAELLEDSLEEALRLLEAGDLAGGSDLLKRLAEQSRESYGPHRLLARAYFRGGDLDAAMRELRWLEIHGFEHAEFALLRATIALRRRELSEAIDQAEYARHLHDPLPAADVILGEVHYRRGEIQSAEAAYHRALDEESHRVAALAGLAAISLRRGDFESSVDWALQALAEDMRLPAVHYRLGLALLRIGRQVEAATALEMAAQLSPQLAGPHRWLAEIYESSDVPRAAEHCRLGREIVARRRGERARRLTLQRPVH